ncbi:basic salivary proline-rich protein 4 [Aricia agestis]|uniref:basic salivary proline-rich protein 4 n=1 Tax=Aricia agestis TaxID=91739 RepID=UPI001C209A35|nr:basic salivary proline-rich protein 4 [Aricia agestis]
MTSTSFNVGLQDNTRLSSRVLRPPGGGHTDIFGGEPEPTRGRRAGPPPASTNHTVGQGDIPAKPMNGAEAPTQNGQEAKEQPQPQAQPQAEQPQPQPQAEQPQAKITPEAPKASPAVTPTEKTEPPKRVRVPPGGFSSGLW